MIKQEWHSMDSAPKGRRILIATESEVYAANWSQNYITGDEAWRIASLDIDGDNQVLIKQGLAIAWTELPEHPGRKFNV